MTKAPVWNFELQDLEQTQNTVLVLEIYAEWCGYCKAIQTIFRRIQLEQGDDKVQYAHVRAELFPQDVEDFQKYVALRGKSRPCFDIYKNGRFKERFFGCAMPKIQEKILAIIKAPPDDDILPDFNPETAIAEEQKIEAKEQADEDQKAAVQQVKARDEVILTEKPLDYKAGKVHIKVVGVHDVVSLDPTGKSDPYFKVKFADKEAQTKKLKNTTSGEYNEDFSFDFDPSTTQDRELKLELWDYDTFGKDDQIGKADIPIKSFRSAKKPVVVNINGTGDNYGQKVGQLDAVVLYEVPNEKIAVQQRQQSFAFTGVEYKPGTVFVNIIGVTNVAGVDSNGKSDPYIKVRFGGLDYETKHMKDTLKAEYNEEFTFAFDPIKTLERQVLLELWDYDTVGDNDQIGNARIQISEFRNRRKKIDIDFRGVGKLYGQKVGKLSTEVLYQVYGEKQLSDKPIIQEYKAGKLNLNIIGVKEVAAADTNDKSDPYIVVKFAGIEDKTEKQKNVTEAVYNKEFNFDFDPDATEERQVNLELWDYNTIGKNELLGKANVPIPTFKSESERGQTSVLDFRGVDSRFLQNVGKLEYEAIYIGPEGGQGESEIFALRPRTSSRAFAGEDGQPSIDELERTARINEQDEGEDKTEYKKGKVTVRIVGVRDIEPIYKGGKSDAFVLVKFNDEEKKTLTVKDTLNAEFNDEFVFDFDPENVEDKTILFELWDSDNITKNDFLGEIKTRLGNYKEAPHLVELDFYGFDDRK
ncbi:MAG: hypothetical protein EZS28_007644, partial [Streblomastix strix]